MWGNFYANYKRNNENFYQLIIKNKYYQNKKISLDQTIHLRF